ncbi:hypothetical protein ACFFWC_08835 [Plantactinospora siamensis]|uniref:Uncharacterized protein n=1 Tax=Plantactinospora siamensis TaxID=555372 RepID=A0ABV6P483_9ACTN
MTAERVDSSPAIRGEQYIHGYGLGVWNAHSERDEAMLAAIHDLVLDRLT